MLIKIPTDKTVNKTVAALQTAVEANHFGVMQVHNLQESMAKKGVEFAHECLIFEVCNPKQAKKVLVGNMSLSTALPNLHLRGRRQNRPGDLKADSSAGDVQGAAIGRCGAGSGNRDCENDAGSGRLTRQAVHVPWPVAYIGYGLFGQADFSNSNQQRIQEKMPCQKNPSQR